MFKVIILLYNILEVSNDLIVIYPLYYKENITSYPIKTFVSTINYLYISCNLSNLSIVFFLAYNNISKILNEA